MTFDCDAPLPPGPSRLRRVLRVVKESAGAFRVALVGWFLVTLGYVTASAL